MKGIAFLGDRSQFVVSGCDTGHLFVYDSASGRVVTALRGDSQGAINCISPHPSGIPLLLTSGLSHDAKVWQPGGRITCDWPSIAALVRHNSRERAMAWRWHRADAGSGDDGDDDDDDDEDAEEAGDQDDGNDDGDEDTNADDDHDGGTGSLHSDSDSLGGGGDSGSGGSENRSSESSGNGTANSGSSSEGASNDSSLSLSTGARSRDSAIFPGVGIRGVLGSPHTN